ncbi:MAG TPA: SdrD B-like domain-containing protein, partial [Candidatus Limnocylindria bacterium]|nr:SdrD B-like domain-containing protein [Candidatus Limnocylindria bacterium]
NADGSAAANGDEVFIQSAVTDASGKYLFVGLPDGNYLVTVNTAANSLPASFSSTTTYEQDGSHNSQNAATISGGNAVLDRDFGYPLAASLKYSVSGKVWNDQNANGSQDANYETNTFVGVTVTAQIDLNGDGAADYTLTTTTGAQGGYSFTNIPGGSNVQIIVDTTTLPSPGYTQVDDPDATKDNQTSITNLGSNVTGRDFGYQGVIRLGNRVWLDNGAGVGGTNNDGLQNGTEPGISNVVVQVYSADPVWGTPTGSALATTTTDTNGYYAFYLNAGDYVIVIPSTNFANATNVLFGLYSSGTSSGTFNGIDPDLNPTDKDDNGFNAVNPASSGVYSAAFTLAVGTAPTGETDLGPGDSLATDNSANLTVDFGFTTASPTAVTLAYVKGWWSAGQVTVEWKTVTEMNTLGFDLERLTINGWVRVNQDLVPALNVEKGGVYRVNDPMGRPSGTIRYLLVEHETTGKRIEYGPFDVTADPAATVVSMQFVDRALDFQFQGDPATDYQVESTDDLVKGNWQPVGVFRSDPLGMISFHQPVEGSEPVRFYRAVRP